MNFLNELVRSAESANLSETLYNTLNVVGGFIALFFNFWYGKKLKIPFFKIIALTVIHIAVLLATMLFLCWVDTGFTYFGTKEISKGFIYSIPTAYLCSKAFKVKYGAVLNMFAITPLFVHAVARMGCLFTGCCYGYPCEWGFYSIRRMYNTFPVQLVEILFLTLMIIVLTLISKKQKYAPNGRLMPIMLITYAILRFLTEFKRDNEKLWENLSVVSLHCIFMLVVGVIFYYEMKRRNLCATNEEQSS